MGLLEADDVDLPLMNVIADDAGLARPSNCSLSVISYSHLLVGVDSPMPG